jgi:hypothetical protein
MYICTYINIYHRQFSPHPAFGRPVARPSSNFRRRQPIHRRTWDAGLEPREPRAGGVEGADLSGCRVFSYRNLLRNLDENLLYINVDDFGEPRKLMKTYGHHIGAPADPRCGCSTDSPVFPLEACPIDGAVLQRPTAEHAAFPVGVTQLMFFHREKHEQLPLKLL